MIEHHHISQEDIDEALFAPELQHVLEMDAPIKVVPSIRDVAVKELYTSDVEVHEVIENSILTIHGDLICNGDIRNSTVIVLGKAYIEGECVDSALYVKNGISVRSVRQSDISSEEDISIGVEIRESNVSAGGMIYAETASVYGGRLSAYTHIVVKRALKPSADLLTSLVVGDSTVIRRKQQALERLLAGAEHAVTIKKESTQAYVKSLITSGKFKVDDSKLVQLQKEQSQLEGAANGYQELLTTFLCSHEQSTYKPSIHVGGEVSVGVFIEVLGTKKILEFMLSSGVFTAHMDEIIVTSYFD